MKEKFVIAVSYNTFTEVYTAELWNDDAKCRIPGNHGVSGRSAEHAVVNLIRNRTNTLGIEVVIP